MKVAVRMPPPEKATPSGLATSGSRSSPGTAVMWRKEAPAAGPDVTELGLDHRGERLAGAIGRHDATDAILSAVPVWFKSFVGPRSQQTREAGLGVNAGVLRVLDGDEFRFEAARKLPPGAVVVHDAFVRILFIGDIVGRPGRDLLQRGLTAIVATTASTS